MVTPKNILGIRFSIGDASSLVEEALRGGLVVAPSAPVMVALESNEALREALTDADLAITDSGYMALLWRVLQGERITRVSGLEYLRQLLTDSSFKVPNMTLWVMPDKRACECLLAWLKIAKIPIALDNCYLAPTYSGGRLDDSELLATVRRLRPVHIILGLGGGVQERLGYHIKHSIDYRPTIHCIGGAIGFLTGAQVWIPQWADHFYLGWLFRILSNPIKFFPRYWRARRLFGLVWRYKDKLPPLAANAR